MLDKLPPISLLALLFSWICRLKFKHKVKQIMQHHVKAELVQLHLEVPKNNLVVCMG